MGLLAATLTLATLGADPLPPAEAREDPAAWGTRLEGVHPFLGVSAAGGFLFSWGGAFLLRGSVTGGLFLGRFDLRLEVSPLSELPFWSRIGQPSMVLAASAGYFAPLVERPFVATVSASLLF